MITDIKNEESVKDYKCNYIVFGLSYYVLLEIVAQFTVDCKSTKDNGCKA